MTRILSLLVLLMPFGWGVWSIRAGIRISDFGPILGGIMFCLFAVIVASIIIIDWAEQIVNDFKRRSVNPLKPCGCHESIDCKCIVFRGQITGIRDADLTNEQLRELGRINTPDPNLIHPDDAKRLDIKV